VIEDLPSDLDLTQLPGMVGEYRNEGLGRVIYNPEFLNYKEDATWDYKLIKTEKFGKDNSNGEGQRSAIDISKLNTGLGKILAKKHNDLLTEQKIGEQILKVIHDEPAFLEKRISKSQWGEIRKRALRAKNMDTLLENLFKPKEGYLVHGVAAEKIWDKKGGKSRKSLRRVIEQNKDLGTEFVAKLAAELAKKL
jgi:hypothetical protein